jgi:hypothetical protein
MMNHSTQTNEGTSNDEESKETSKVGATATDPMASPPSSPRRKGQRTKSTKAKSTVTKSPKKLAPLPPRALNAYNIFFREERKRWIDQRSDPEEQNESKTKTASTFPPFAQMGKIIGQKWKELPAGEKEKFERLAKEDMQRYRKAIDDYKNNLIQETEKSAETLGKDTVSSAWNYRSSSSEDDVEDDSKPKASDESHHAMPITNWPSDALPPTIHATGPPLSQGYYPFRNESPSLSQAYTQTQMHNMLNEVCQVAQDANMFAYSQQQQQQHQLLSMLLPRMTLQQSQVHQQHHLRQQLQRNQHELLLLQLAGGHQQQAHPSLGLLRDGVPMTNQLLQAQQWQSAAPLPPTFPAELDIQLRASALLSQLSQQQHHHHQQQQEEENAETNAPPPPPFPK